MKQILSKLWKMMVERVATVAIPTPAPAGHPRQRGIFARVAMRGMMAMRGRRDGACPVSTRGILMLALIALMAFPTNTAAQVNLGPPPLAPNQQILWEIGGFTFTRAQIDSIRNIGGIIHMPVYVTLPVGVGFPATNTFLGASTFNFEIRHLDGTPMSYMVDPLTRRARHLQIAEGFVFPGNHQVGFVRETGAQTFVPLEAVYGGTATTGGMFLPMDALNIGARSTLFHWPVGLDPVNTGSFQLCFKLETPFLCPSNPGTAPSSATCPGGGARLILQFQQGATTLTNLTESQAHPSDFTMSNVGETGFVAGELNYRPLTFNRFVCGVVNVLAAPDIEIGISSLCPWDTAFVWVDINAHGQAFDDTAFGGTGFGVGFYEGGVWVPLGSVVGIERVILGGNDGTGGRFTARYYIMDPYLMSPFGRLSGVEVLARGSAGGESGLGSVVVNIPTVDRRGLFLHENVTPFPEQTPVATPNAHRKIFSLPVGFQALLATHPLGEGPTAQFAQRDALGNWIPVTVGADIDALYWFTVSGPGEFLGFNTTLVAGCRIPTDTIQIVLPMFAEFRHLPTLCQGDTEMDIDVFIENPSGDDVRFDLIEFYVNDFNVTGFVSPSPSTLTPGFILLNQTFTIPVPPGQTSVTLRMEVPNPEGGLEIVTQVLTVQQLPGGWANPFAIMSSASGTAVGSTLTLRPAGTPPGTLTFTPFFLNYDVYDFGNPIATNQATSTFEMTLGHTHELQVVGRTAEGCIFTSNVITPGGIGDNIFPIETNVYGHQVVCFDTIYLRAEVSPIHTAQYWVWAVRWNASGPRDPQVAGNDFMLVGPGTLNALETGLLGPGLRGERLQDYLPGLAIEVVGAPGSTWSTLRIFPAGSDRTDFQTLLDQIASWVSTNPSASDPPGGAEENLPTTGRFFALAGLFNVEPNPIWPPMPMMWPALHLERRVFAVSGGGSFVTPQNHLIDGRRNIQPHGVLAGSPDVVPGAGANQIVPAVRSTPGAMVFDPMFRDTAVDADQQVWLSTFQNRLHIFNTGANFAGGTLASYNDPTTGGGGNFPFFPGTPGIPGTPDIPPVECSPAPEHQGQPLYGGGVCAGPPTWGLIITPGIPGTPDIPGTENTPAFTGNNFGAVWQHSTDEGSTWVDLTGVLTGEAPMGDVVGRLSPQITAATNHFRVSYQFALTPLCLPRAGDIAIVRIATADEILGTLDVPTQVCGLETISITATGSLNMATRTMWVRETTAAAWHQLDVVPGTGNQSRLVDLEALFGPGGTREHTFAEGDLIHFRLTGIGGVTGDPYDPEYLTTVTFRRVPSVQILTGDVEVCLGASISLTGMSDMTVTWAWSVIGGSSFGAFSAATSQITNYLPVAAGSAVGRAHNIQLTVNTGFCSASVNQTVTIFDTAEVVVTATPPLCWVQQGQIAEITVSPAGFGANWSLGTAQALPDGFEGGLGGLFRNICGAVVLNYDNSEPVLYTVVVQRTAVGGPRCPVTRTVNVITRGCTWLNAPPSITVNRPAQGFGGCNTAEIDFFHNTGLTIQFTSQITDAAVVATLPDPVVHCANTDTIIPSTMSWGSGNSGVITIAYSNFMFGGVPGSGVGHTFRIRVDDVCGLYTNIIEWTYYDCQEDNVIVYPADVTQSACEGTFTNVTVRVTSQSDLGTITVTPASGSPQTVTGHTTGGTAPNRYVVIPASFFATAVAHTITINNTAPVGTAGTATFTVHPTPVLTNITTTEPCQGTAVAFTPVGASGDLRLFTNADTTVANANFAPAATAGWSAGDHDFWGIITSTQGCRSAIFPSSLTILAVSEGFSLTPLTETICSGENLTVRASRPLESTEFSALNWTGLTPAAGQDFGQYFTFENITSTVTIGLTAVTISGCPTTNLAAGNTVAVTVRTVPSGDITIQRQFTEVCEGQQGGNLTVTPPTFANNAVVRIVWERSDDGSATWNEIGETTSVPHTVAAGVINAAAAFRAIVHFECGTLQGGTSIGVTTLLDAPTVPADQWACQGTANMPLVINGIPANAVITFTPANFASRVGTSGNQFTINGSAAMAAGAHTFTVEFTDVAGCPSAEGSGTFTIRPNDFAVPQLITPDAVCQGDPSTIAFANHLGGLPANSVLTWSPATITGTHPTYTGSFNVTTEVTVTLTVNQCPIGTSAPVTAEVRPNPSTSIAITPTAPSICQGLSQTLTATVTGTDPANNQRTGLQWYTVVGATWTAIDGETSATLTVTPNATTQFGVRIHYPCGGPISSTPVTVNVVTAPVITNFVANPVCEGATVTFTSNVAGTQLRLFRGTTSADTTLANFFEPSATASWLAAESPHHFVAVVTDISAGCRSLPFFGTVTILPVSTGIDFTISPSTPVCANEELTLTPSRALAPGEALTWTHNGTAFVPGGSAPNFTVNAGSANGTIGLSAQIGTCAATTPVTQSYVVRLSPGAGSVAVTTGSASVCFGDAGPTLTASEGTVVNNVLNYFRWEIRTGGDGGTWVAVSPAATGPTFTVPNNLAEGVTDFRAVAVYTYCGFAVATSHQRITVAPFIDPPTALAGEMCFGTATTQLRATPQGSARFSGTLPVGSISATGGVTGAATLPVGSYSFTAYTYVLGCRSTESTGTLTVVARPADLVVTAVEQVCAGNDALVTLNDNAIVAGSTLTWAVTGASAMSNPAGPAPFYVTAQAAGTMTVIQSVQHAAYNNLTCVSLPQSPVFDFTLLPGPPPAPTISFATDSTVCYGAGVRAFTISNPIPAPLATEYILRWGNNTLSRPTHTALQDAVNSPTYRPLLTATTVFTLRVNVNACPDSVISAPVTVTVNPYIPPPNITFPGDAWACQGGTIVFNFPSGLAMTFTGTYADELSGTGTSRTINTANISVGNQQIIASAIQTAGGTWCPASGTSEVNFEVRTQPTVVASASYAGTEMCRFDAVNLSAATPEGGSVVWMPGNISGSTHTVPAGWANNTTFTATVTLNGCTASDPITLVSLCDEPEITVNMPANLCQGPPGSIYAGVVVGQPYVSIWTNDGRGISRLEISVGGVTTGTIPTPTVTVTSTDPANPTVINIPASYFSPNPAANVTHTVTAFSVTAPFSGFATTIVRQVPAAPGFSAFPDPLCQGLDVLSFDGRITGIPANRSSFYISAIAPTAGAFNVSTSSWEVIDPQDLAAGTYHFRAYYVTAAIYGQCTSANVEGTFEIRPTDFTIPELATPDPVCQGVNSVIGFVDTNPFGSLTDVVLTWNVGGTGGNQTTPARTVQLPVGSNPVFLTNMTVRGCPHANPNFNTVQAVVYVQPTVATISGQSNICLGGEMNTLTITSAQQTDVTYVWQWYVAGNWETIATPSQGPIGGTVAQANLWFDEDFDRYLTASRMFRVLSVSGVCPPAESNPQPVVVYPQPVMPANALALTPGTTTYGIPSAFTPETFVLSGLSGVTNVSWFFCHNATAAVDPCDHPGTPIAGGTLTGGTPPTGATFPALTLASRGEGPGFYTMRAMASVVLSGTTADNANCDTPISNPVVIDVRADATWGLAGLVAPNYVCEGDDAVVVRLNRSTGTFCNIVWQTSTLAHALLTDANDSPNWTTVQTVTGWDEWADATEAGLYDELTLPFAVSTGVVQVRVIVDCDLLASEARGLVEIVVDAATVAGAITPAGPEYVCLGANYTGAISLGGHSGHGMQFTWFRGVGGADSVAIGTANNPSAVFPTAAAGLTNIQDSIRFWVNVASRACPTVQAGPLVIRVYPTPVITQNLTFVDFPTETAISLCAITGTGSRASVNMEIAATAYGANADLTFYWEYQCYSARPDGSWMRTSSTPHSSAVHYFLAPLDQTAPIYTRDYRVIIRNNGCASTQVPSRYLRVYWYRQLVPSVGLSPSTSPLCESDVLATVSVNPADPFLTTAVVWALNGTVITGETGVSVERFLTSPTASTTHTFRATVTNDVCPAIYAEQTVTIVQAPVAHDITATPNVICVGGVASSTTIATGAAYPNQSFVWLFIGDNPADRTTTPPLNGVANANWGLLTDFTAGGTTGIRLRAPVGTAMDTIHYVRGQFGAHLADGVTCEPVFSDYIAITVSAQPQITVTMPTQMHMCSDTDRITVTLANQPTVLRGSWQWEMRTPAAPATWVYLTPTPQTGAVTPAEYMTIGTLTPGTYEFRLRVTHGTACGFAVSDITPVRVWGEITPGTLLPADTLICQWDYVSTFRIVGTTSVDMPTIAEWTVSGDGSIDSYSATGATISFQTLPSYTVNVTLRNHAQGCYATLGPVTVRTTTQLTAPTMMVTTASPICAPGTITLDVTGIDADATHIELRSAVGGAVISATAVTQPTTTITWSSVPAGTHRLAVRAIRAEEGQTSTTVACLMSQWTSYQVFRVNSPTSVGTLAWYNPIESPTDHRERALGAPSGSMRLTGGLYVENDYVSTIDWVGEIRHAGIYPLWEPFPGTGYWFGTAAQGVHTGVPTGGFNELGLPTPFDVEFRVTLTNAGCDPDESNSIILTLTEAQELFISATPHPACLNAPITVTVGGPDAILVHTDVSLGAATSASFSWELWDRDTTGGVDDGIRLDAGDGIFDGIGGAFIHGDPDLGSASRIFSALQNNRVGYLHFTFRYRSTIVNYPYENIITAVVRVDALSDPGELERTTGLPIVCQNQIERPLFTLVDYVGTIQRWEWSADGEPSTWVTLWETTVVPGVAGVPIVSGSTLMPDISDYAFGGFFRAVVRNGAWCTEEPSDALGLEIIPTASPGAFNMPNPLIVQYGTDVIITLTDSTGGTVSFRWLYSRNQGQTWHQLLMPSIDDLNHELPNFTGQIWFKAEAPTPDYVPCDRLTNILVIQSFDELEWDESASFTLVTDPEGGPDIVFTGAGTATIVGVARGHEYDNPDFYTIPSSEIVYVWEISCPYDGVFVPVVDIPGYMYANENTLEVAEDWWYDPANADCQFRLVATWTRTDSLGVLIEEELIRGPFVIRLQLVELPEIFIVSDTICIGGTAEFTIMTTAVPVPDWSEFDITWYIEGVQVPGANGLTLQYSGDPITVTEGRSNVMAQIRPTGSPQTGSTPPVGLYVVQPLQVMLEQFCDMANAVRFEATVTNPSSALVADANWAWTIRWYRDGVFTNVTGTTMTTPTDGDYHVEVVTRFCDTRSDYISVELVPLVIESMIVGEETAFVSPRRLVTFDDPTTVELNMLTLSPPTNLAFEWTVLPATPQIALTGGTAFQGTTTAMFTEEFRGVTQSIQAVVTNTVTGCRTFDTVDIRLAQGLTLDTIFATIISNRRAGNDTVWSDIVLLDEDLDYTFTGTPNELPVGADGHMIVCVGHIIYFTPAFSDDADTVGMDLSFVWTMNGEHVDWYAVNGTLYSQFGAGDVLVGTDFTAGFRVPRDETVLEFEITVLSHGSPVATGIVIANVRSTAHVAMHVAPTMFERSYFENQVINFMMAPGRFESYEFWRFVGESHEVDLVDLTNPSNQLIDGARVGDNRPNPVFDQRSPMFSTRFPAGSIRALGLDRGTLNIPITVVGVAIDSYGCEAQSEITIRLVPVPTILVTEGSSEANRVLFPNFEVEVFNTWGIRIQSFGEARGWDPRFRSRDIHSGTYYYNARIPTPEGYIMISGAITVMRDLD